jgi:hypothetical protein
MNLATEAELLGVRVHLGAETRSILRDVLRIVIGQAAEIECVERCLADAADARRESRSVRAGRVPADQRQLSRR